MISNGHQLDRTILWMLIVFEALLFYTFYAREIAPYPPQAYDQAVYLAETYALQEHIHTKGLGEVWRAVFSNNHAGTLALPIEGALFGLILGGTRLPQLCVLFVAFCALQIFAFQTAHKVWGQRAYGFMLLGLILCQDTLWFFAGGLFDFRIDFLAYSLYGIWACSVIRSSFFLDRRWAIACGLISALLVLNRFLSVIYVVGVSIGFAGACLIVWFRNRNDADLSRRMRQRLFNLGFSLGVLAIIVAPILMFNWGEIYHKYVYAQFTYEKDVRAREFGIFDLRGHLLYYPRSILLDHLGPSFLWASGIGFVAAFVTRLFAKSTAPKPTTNWGGETLLLEFIFLVGAIIGPIIILTIDISKSPVIGSIVGVPVALLLVGLIARIIPVINHQLSSPARKILLASSLAILAIGLYHLFDKASRHRPEYAEHSNLKRCTELNKWLAEYATAHGLRDPGISVDVISGWFNASAFATSGYEQTHELVDFQQTLGAGGIMGVGRAEALSSLEKGDFVILTTLPKTGVYPFYQQIAQYWNDLKTWADQNLIIAKTIQFDGFSVTVYVRPKPAILGTLNGWITRDGFSIEASRAELERFPVVRLAGPANFSWLPKTPSVSAAIETEKDPLAVHASLRRTDGGYEIQIDTPSDLPPGDPIRLHVTFDTFFIPKNLGVSPDTRELVVPAPSLVQLLHRESGLNDSSR
jgi:hypothetical protein